MNLSYQLYSSRFVGDWEAVLAHLAKTGYAEVEGFMGAIDNPADFRASLDRHGLSMPSMHLGIEDLEADIDGAIETAKTLGVGHVFAPYLDAGDRPTDAAGWQAFAARLATVHQSMTAAGLGFGWHNHDFEFVTLADGSVPMAHILDAAPEIAWEADVAWIVRGGADPFEWIKRYAGRIASVHIKDIAPAGECEDEDGWADVGQGTMPWDQLMTLIRAETKASIFVMEHDKPSDAYRFAERSFAYISGLEG